MREVSNLGETGDEIADQLRRLALPIDRRSGEGLREAAHRACLWNAFPRPKVILGLAECTSVRQLSALATCDNRIDLHGVAEVIGLSTKDREAILGDRPTAHASRDFVAFFGHAVRRGHISNARRIAPRAVANGAALKAIWSLKPLPLDPQSREFLCDRCPSCGAVLGWEVACDAWICSLCMADVRDIPDNIYEPNDEKALDFVALLLDSESGDRRISVPPGSELSNESEGDLFQLAVRIAQTCQRVEGADRETTIEPRHLEKAGRAILNWPQGFVELMDKMPALPPDDGELGWFNSKPLRRLQFDPTVSATIRCRIKGLLDCTRRTEAVTSLASTLSKSAERPVADELKRLKHPRSALLSLIKNRDTKGGDHLTACMHFVTAFRDISAVRRFSEDIGVPVPDVCELHKCGLAPELATAIAHLGPLPVLKIEGSLITNISKAVRPGTGNGALSLMSCRFALDPSLEVSWSSILQAVLDGRLEVWRGMGSKRGLLSELLVNDFSTLRALISEQSTFDEYRNASISHREVSMIIDRTRSIAAHIIHSSLMPGVFTAGKFAELRKSWAFGFELQTLAAMTCRPIKNLHRKLKSVDIRQTMSGDVTFWQRDEALSYLGLDTA
ncbi:hypothetical protein [Rhizobium leguminosarum]|uniref:hypothetical protein n=1 Tax=Rhizobium leguminosarum TaxID=384 RepID=UPI001C97E231|nr:hypothetical protein [Rhizobium leguminosarum]MBY5406152.1 hypothetical protein [Rhizobium leguminosarum]